MFQSNTKQMMASMALQQKRILFIVVLILSINASVKGECGGILMSPSGTIQTPNFPHEFQTPILCRWIIDASDIATPNTSIIVYLTQVFVTEGLTFDEYETYDVSYNLVGRRIYSVAEDYEDEQKKWVQTWNNVLVITLDLKTTENTHLRVLDSFLDVFGFNITYEITNKPVREDACTMETCGFTGTCRYNFEKFYCNCFPGFSGDSCSEGKRSICMQGLPYCHADGVCRHVGQHFARCFCSEGYAGVHCEQIVPPYKSEVCDPENNLSECICRSGPDSKPDDASVKATIIFNQSPKPTMDGVKKAIKNEMANSRMKLRDPNDIQLRDFNEFHWGTETRISFYLTTVDPKRLESLIEKWKTRGRIGQLHLLNGFPRHRTPSHPRVTKVYLKEEELIREGDDFTIVCETFSYKGTKYRWYKDGVALSVTRTPSNKEFWVAAETKNNSLMTSTLHIKNASYADQGKFACVVEDYEYQHCMTIFVEVIRAPMIEINPLSLSVPKGGNFTIRCVLLEPPPLDQKYTYSWTKNKELLPVKNDAQKYEIIYPSGSLLEVYNIEKSTTYSCLVQDERVASEATIHVDVYDKEQVRLCPAQECMNVVWPETPPGATSIQKCPTNFTGSAKRTCEFYDPQKSQWQLPDFSDCKDNRLVNTEKALTEIILGYEFKTELDIVLELQYMVSNKHRFLPGEGENILKVINDVLPDIDSNYQFEQDLIEEIISTALDVVGRSLQYKYAYTKEYQIAMVQKTIQKLMFYSNRLIGRGSWFRRNFGGIRVIAAHQDAKKRSIMLLPPINTCCDGPEWTSFIVTMSPSAVDGGFTMITVYYKHLPSFLPSQTIVRLKNGTAQEYKMISAIAAVWILTNGGYVNRIKTPLDVVLFHQPFNSSRGVWDVHCAWVPLVTHGQDWDINICKMDKINSTATQCLCPHPGAFAILAQPIYIDENCYLEQLYCLVGCLLCLLLSLFTLAMLSIHWLILQTCISFLKAQNCFVLVCSNAFFVRALAGEIPKDLYCFYATSLATFFLVALSTHISKCLVVFTEFAQNVKAPKLNKATVAIGTGVPIITVLVSDLTHRTMENKPNSWWLISGSMSFNIFVSAFLVMIVLYNLVYLMVMERISEISKDDKVQPVVKERKRFLRRSFYLFWATTIMICLSIMYVNARDSAMWGFAFTTSNIFLMLVIVFCYITYPETPIWKYFTITCSKTATDVIEINWDKSPSSCSTASKKSRPASDTKSIAPQLSDLQNIAEQALNDAHLKQSKEEVQEYMYSPDVVATRVHVELDLVAPMVHEKNMEDPVVFCNTAVNPRCETFKSFIPSAEENQVFENVENASKLQERLQPEGLETLFEEEEVAKSDENDDRRSVKSVKAVAQDTMDGMLDKISHDLDYLLNRKNSVSAVSVSIDNVAGLKNSETECNF